MMSGAPSLYERLRGMRMTLPAWTRGGLDQGDADDLVACLDGPTRLPTRWTSSLTESEEVRNI